MHRCRILRPSSQLGHAHSPSPPWLLSSSALLVRRPVSVSGAPPPSRHDRPVRRAQHPELATHQWHPSKPEYRAWRKTQALATKAQATRQLVPDKFRSYDHSFDERVLPFERQLESLRQRGFLRAYRPYTPPEDVSTRFLRVCARVLGDRVDFTAEGGDVAQLETVRLDAPDAAGRADKAHLLDALRREFSGHAVPNAMLHSMNTLDRLFHFYSTPVDVRTPYEKLHTESRRGKLPPNLHIQLEPHRFGQNKTSTNPLDRITAFPQTRTILVSPESRKKYKDDESATADGEDDEVNPWINSQSDYEESKKRY